MGIMAGRRRRAQVEVAKATSKPVPKVDEPSKDQEKSEVAMKKKGKHGLV